MRWPRCEEATGTRDWDEGPGSTHNVAVSVIRLSPVSVILRADENDTLARFGRLVTSAPIWVAIHY